MKALVFHGPRQLRWQDWPDPLPAAGQAVVAVRAVGICGSDLHGYTGESGRRIPPMVMGHEFTGEVVDGRGGAAGGGRRVIVRPFLHCGTCAACTAGRENLCARRVYLGANADGAMATHVAVPLANLLPLADDVSFAHGALTEPLAVAVHAARQAGDIAGQTVLVAGSGPIGLFTALAARRQGAARVIATDTRAPRRAAALAIGADAALDPGDAGFADALRAAVPDGGGIAAAFDAVGVPQTFAQCVDAVVPGGMVVAIGGWQTVPVALPKVVAREITIRGAFNFTPRDFDLAWRWIADRVFDPAILVTDIRRMEDGAHVFADIVERRLDGIKVVLVNEAAP
jgi:L-iditol 2-dehydrogenase